MAGFDVNIRQDIIDSMTENTPSLMGVTLNGKPVTVPYNNIASGFTSAARALLKASVKTGAKAEKYVSYWITKDVKGNYVDFIEIPNNSKTTELFSIFKKYGMFVTKFLCGYDANSGTMYVSAKTARDMSRMPNETNAAIVMYILSLMHFVKAASANIADVQLDVYSDVVNVVGTEEAPEHLFRAFDLPCTVKVQASGTDDLQGIKYVRNELTSTGVEVTGPSMKFAYLFDAKKGEYVGAVVPVTAGVAQYTFIATESKVYTDFELCTVELRDDSLCTNIASGYVGSISVIKSTDLSAYLKDLELHMFDEIPEGIPGWLYAWSKLAINKGATAASSADVKHILKFGAKVPKGYAGCDPEEIKAQYVSDTYAQELYKQAKPYYDTFELGNLTANLAGFAKGAIYAMAFVGESGTGKSTAARVIPYRCGMPYLSVNFSVNIEEADLFGSMFPNPAKSKPEDPEFVWQDGVITKAVRNGYVAILEEINFARPGVLGKLNSLLDENRQLDLPNGEVLRAHPNFRIIATCNIAYEGTNRFNKALINRFDDVTVFKDLKRDETIEVIKTRTGYSDKAKLDKIYNVYEALKKFATEQNVNLVVSMRQLLNIFTKGRYYKDARDAVSRIMLNGAFLEDTEYQKVFEDTVLPAFDLKFRI
jgi:MoxR-like ATPase